MEIDRKQASVVTKIYQEDPIKFFVDVLGVPQEFIWYKMKEVAEAVRDNRKTAVKAGHSVSKTYTAARLALWFLYCFGPRATVVTTAPSHSQVEQLLWREIRDAHANATVPLGGEPTKTQLDLSEKWFATGFSTRPDTVTQQATRVQGYHNDHLLVIFDEAAGIEKPIWDAADGLLTSGHVRFLAIGNPTTSMGNFPNCFKDSSFKQITISCLDTPNFIKGKDIIPGLANLEYVDDMKKRYGEDSDVYKSRILGQIPENDINQLIHLSWIEAAEGRESYSEYKFKKRFITVDPSDGGDDCVLKAWENKTEIDEVVIKGKEVEECEPYAWRLLRKIGGNAVIIDADGIGRVLVRLMSASKNKDVSIIAFKGSSKDGVNLDMHRNWRDQGHWMMREDFKENIISISKDEEQREELLAARIAEDKDGLIVMEKKDLVKERLGGKSPNKADNIMMMSACFSRVKPLSVAPDKWAGKFNGSGTKDYNWRTA